MTGLASSPAPAIRSRSASGPRDAGAGPAERERRPHHDRVAQLGRGRAAVRQGVADPAGRHLGADADHDLLELVAVLPGPDRLDAGPDELDVVLGERAVVVQGNGRVQRRLAAEGRQDRVRPFLGDHLLQHVRRDRLDVGGVGELRVGHDRGRVGVDQADADALGPQHPAGLRAGVVELARLPDDDRPRPDDQHGLEVLAPRHAGPSISSQNSVNRPAASCGPGAASGWYWTLNAGASSSRRPSTTPSLRLTCVIWAGPKSVSKTPPGQFIASAGWQRHREAVVVAGDLHLAGADVLHGLVHAAVAEAQLVGAKAERPAEHLAAQADAEHRRAGREHAAHGIHRVADRRRDRPGRWRKTRRRGLPARISAVVAVAGSTCTSQPSAAMARGVAALMPRSTAATRYRTGVPSGGRTTYGSRRRHLPSQVGAGHLRAGQDSLKQFGRVVPSPR